MLESSIVQGVKRYSFMSLHTSDGTPKRLEDVRDLSTDRELLGV